MSSELRHKVITWLHAANKKAINSISVLNFYWKKNYSSFLDTSTQQRRIVPVHNRKSDWPGFQRCSAIGRGDYQVDLFGFHFIYWAPDCTVFNGVFHWLAVSHGSILFVPPPSIFRLTVPRRCCSALAYSGGLWPTHLSNESDCFRDTHYQNACVGRWIPATNQETTKVCKDIMKLIVIYWTQVLCRLFNALLDEVMLFLFLLDSNFTLLYRRFHISCEMSYLAVIGIIFW